VRVAYYVYGWPAAAVANGIVTAVAALAPALREQGCEVRLVAATGDAAGDPAVTILPQDSTPALSRPLYYLRDRLSPHWRTLDRVPQRIAAAVGSAPACTDLTS
jgi:hypothetical protein